MTDEKIRDEIEKFREALFVQSKRLSEDRQTDLYMAVMSLFKDENGDWIGEEHKRQFRALQIAAVANLAQTAIDRMSAGMTLEYLREHPEELEEVFGK